LKRTVKFLNKVFWNGRN